MYSAVLPPYLMIFFGQRPDHLMAEANNHYDPTIFFAFCISGVVPHVNLYKEQYCTYLNLLQ